MPGGERKGVGSGPALIMMSFLPCFPTLPGPATSEVSLGLTSLGFRGLGRFMLLLTDPLRSQLSTNRFTFSSLSSKK